MRYYFNMAWRNIWRNKRRTLITAASIFFAVFFAIFMRAIQLGSYDNMINNVVQAYTGYIQIFDHRYPKDETINHTIEFDEGIMEDILSNPNVTSAVPRLESFALASSGNQSKGVLLVGTDPVLDNQLTNLANKVVAGEYLQKGESGLMVSERLSNFLNCTVGDTIVLISQGYHGTSAADQYEIIGILKLPSPELDNKTIIMDLAHCQDFFTATSRLTSISLNIAKEKKMNRTVKELQTVLGDQYKVKGWRKILTELVQQIEGDNIGGIIMLGILYLIVGFGVFGTVMMMTSERRKEFGVMVAVGMQKNRLGGILVLEMIMIGALGVLSGVLVSVPIVYYLHIHPFEIPGEMAETIIAFGMEPVMPTAWKAGYFFSQAGVVFVLVSIAISVPIRWVTRLKVNKALRA